MHFIVKALANFGDEIQNLNVLPYNGENFRTLSFNSFEFCDSLAFLQAPLSSLSSDLKDTDHSYEVLKQTYLVKTDRKFDPVKFDMVLKKSFFPYEYCTSLSQMRETKKLPKRKHFYSSLSEQNITKADYKFAKSVWKKFNCKNLLEYTAVYCKIDTILLCEVFLAFRDDMYNNFSGLDASQYLSLPAFSYDSMLKITGCELSVPTDINQILFLERAKRGGVSCIGTRELKPSRDEDNVKSEIVYVDVNNLYGNSMMCKLPVSDFSWMDDKKVEKFDIETVDLDGDEGYFLECDLSYPSKLHSKHDNLPLAPHLMDVTYDMLSPYAKEALFEDNQQTKYCDKKLMMTFYDRENYVLHGKNLKLYLSLGMKLKKIHKILKFKQDNVLKPYIDLCTKKRQSAKTKFQQDTYKKIANSLYGKTVQVKYYKILCNFFPLNSHNLETAFKVRLSFTFPFHLC